MPGQRTTLRERPDYALEVLACEGRVNIELLGEIVRRVWQLGPCKICDPNTTRALAIHAIDNLGHQMPQFFAILTDRHKGFHRLVGKRGFSIQAAFRKSTSTEPPGIHWVSDRFDYEKVNQIWWRNDLNATDLDLNPIVDVIARARNTFVSLSYAA